METKKINCDLSDEQLRELGEPEAYFSVEIPKEVKNIGKCAEDSKGYRPNLQAVCLEPENGKLIASDTHILYTADVKCSGEWPEASGSTPFQCFIDPKAIRDLAGKTVDIAVWTDENNHQKVTACETVGVLTQHSAGASMAFPNWQRVMPQNHIADIRIAEKDIKPLREFMKANTGKNKTERENRFAVLHITPDADNMQARIINFDGEEIAVTYADLCERPTHYIQQSYDPQLFYYSIQEDFNGEILFSREDGPATFKGECRTSILMPKAHNVIKSYISTENPANE